MGGILSGYKTYLIGASVILAAVIDFFVDGNGSFGDFVDKTTVALEGAGLMTLRAGIKSTFGK